MVSFRKKEPGDHGGHEAVKSEVVPLHDVTDYSGNDSDFSISLGQVKHHYFAPLEIDSPLYVRTSSRKPVEN